MCGVDGCTIARSTVPRPWAVPGAFPRGLRPGRRRPASPDVGWFTLCGSMAAERVHEFRGRSEERSRLDQVLEEARTGQSAVLVVIGVVVGLVLIRIAERALSRVLYEVTPTDAGSTAIASGLLLGAALIACVPPAIRAMRVDPVEGLRAE